LSHLSLGEIAASKLFVVVSDNVHPPDIGVSAVYVSAWTIRREITNWLEGGYADVDITTVIAKCGHWATMEAIASSHERLRHAKWLRVVKFLCALREVKVDLHNFLEKLQHIFAAAKWSAGDWFLLEDLKDMTVEKVADVLYNSHRALVEASDGSPQLKLGLALCESYMSISGYEGFQFHPLDRLYVDMNDRLGALTFDFAVKHGRFPSTPLYDPTSPPPIGLAVVTNPLVKLFVENGGGRNLIHVRDEVTNAQLETGRIQPGCFYSKHPCDSEAPAFTTVDRQLTIESVALPEDLQKCGFLTEFINYLFSKHKLDAVQLRAVQNASFRKHLLSKPDWVCQDRVQNVEWWNPAFVMFKKL
jgi:hypothetical protein